MKKRILHSQIHTEVFRSVLASIIIATGVVSGATALADSPSWPVLNGTVNASPEIAAGVGVHQTRVESLEALQFPNTSEITTQVEAFSAAPPTRSSFMASWDGVSGATGYRLDVSNSPSFDTYVEGYHDLDVGGVTGSVVTGLTPGRTYYYRCALTARPELASTQR